MYGVDDILDGVLAGINVNEPLCVWVREGERGGDPGHPVGPMVFQQIRNEEDGRVFQITAIEIVSNST